MPSSIQDASNTAVSRIYKKSLDARHFHCDEEEREELINQHLLVVIAVMEKNRSGCWGRVLLFSTARPEIVSPRS